VLDFIDTDGELADTSLKFNTATSDAPPDKFTCPTLSTHVLRKSMHSPASRQAQHLPIFFGAISDVEMSRCQPFLEVKFVYPGPLFFPNQKENPKMSYTRFFGYGADKTFTNPIPLNNSFKDDNESILESYSYMNLFTAPQVAVNADYNSENNTFGSILNSSFDIGEEDEDVQRSDLSVLDPFQPFLSLISLDITEQSAGVGGLLSTKNGVLKLKLHDKSRLKQISPMLAVDEFANSHFVIEYGWTHPDGKLTSNNTIGKYINGLRNVASYNVKNVSYSFGSDNTVDITIDIITKGSASVAPRVSCAAGFYQSLHSFEGSIDLAIKAATGGKKASESRKKSVVLNDKLSSPSRLVPFTTLVEVDAAIKKQDFSKLDTSNTLFGDLVRLLKGGLDVDGNTIDEKQTKTFETTYYFKNEGETFQRKWDSLSTSVDPFQLATRFEDKDVTDKVWIEGTASSRKSNFDDGPQSLKKFYDAETDKNSYHVTLGKLITKFVALPMTTAGVYDEVQVFFYPVNHQAGGARRHTTASIPIDAEAFKAQLDKSLQGDNEKERIGSRKLSAIGFVNSLKRYLSDRSISAYDLQEESRGLSAGSIQEIKNKFEKMSREEKISYLTGLPSPPSSTSKPKEIGTFDSISHQFKFNPASTAGKPDIVKKEIEDDAIRKFREGLSKSVLSQIESNLTHIYKNDRVQLAARGGVFQPIRLEVLFEITPTIDEKGAEERGLGSVLTPFADVVNKFKNLKKDSKPPFKTDDGIFVDKTILRMHVYDAGTVPHSDEVVLGLSTRDDGEVIIPKEVGLSPETQKNQSISENKIIKNSRNFWKSVITSKYPTIIHGNSSSVVKSVDVSSNVPPIIANVQIVEGYERTIARQIVDENKAQFDEVQFFPTAVNVSMMGCPMINRGTTLFLDLMTGTSLDNLYQANTVTHSITPGEFTTTVSLLAPNQNIVASVRNRTLEKLRSAASDD
jgi:hypothetical protein